VYLDVADREELVRLESQLPGVERRLPDSESGFLRRLDDFIPQASSTKLSSIRPTTLKGTDMPGWEPGKWT
jgi:hypothetical protein